MRWTFFPFVPLWRCVARRIVASGLLALTWKPQKNGTTPG